MNPKRPSPPPIPFYKLPVRAKTDHAEARRVAERGWGPHKSRADFESSLRYHGAFTLPEA